MIWGAASRDPCLPVRPGKSSRRAGPRPRLALLPPPPNLPLPPPLPPPLLPPSLPPLPLLPLLPLLPPPPPPLLHLAANEKSAPGRPRPRHRT